jgi:LuxR family maltose regulon positive regulatory protein
LGLLAEAERVYNTDLSPEVRPVSAVRARVELANGNIVAARRWASGRGLGADDELSYLREYEHITLARVLVAGDPARSDHTSADDTIRLLERLLTAAEEGQRPGSAIEVLVLLSLALQARDSAAASAALEEALTRAEPEGHIRIFVNELPALTPLLRAFLGHDTVGDQARTLLAAAAPAATAAASHEGIVDELSNRELEVLRLLRTDLSGPAIARELWVSVNTLRTHTKNIYMKLGVNSRREAVRRAAELGL